MGRIDRSTYLSVSAQYESVMKKLLPFLLATLLSFDAWGSRPPGKLRPLKGPLVVLTFDDATQSQRTIVAPLLKKYGFGATFYVCEFPGFENKTHYMTWEQIKELDEMGFEIGNHSRNHGAMSTQSRLQIEQETAYIEEKCAEYGIPRPVTYAYPGCDWSEEGIDVLRERGYRLARICSDTTFVPGETDPMKIPGYGVIDARIEKPGWIERTLDEARNGQVVVFFIHGVPDLAHDFVSTTPENFEKLLAAIKKRKCKVIAMRDLLEYDLSGQAPAETDARSGATNPG